MPNDRSIACFTMEIALEPGMLTYSGGAWESWLGLPSWRPPTSRCPWWPSVCSIARATFIKGWMPRAIK
jgi:hypothetical protein